MRYQVTARSYLVPCDRIRAGATMCIPAWLWNCSALNGSPRSALSEQSISLSCGVVGAGDWPMAFPAPFPTWTRRFNGPMPTRSDELDFQVGQFSKSISTSLYYFRLAVTDEGRSLQTTYSVYSLRVEHAQRAQRITERLGTLRSNELDLDRRSPSASLQRTE